jgi:hypothetical protein
VFGEEANLSEDNTASIFKAKSKTSKDFSLTTTSFGTVPLNLTFNIIHIPVAPTWSIEHP